MGSYKWNKKRKIEDVNPQEKRRAVLKTLREEDDLKKLTNMRMHDILIGKRPRLSIAQKKSGARRIA